ncbi:MAG TPA: metallophosphoesterase [Gemmatimonadaceae bacterium]|nr:metallophosphoesterase [Gemmatimonadaceae bacterium]
MQPRNCHRSASGRTLGLFLALAIGACGDSPSAPVRHSAQQPDANLGRWPATLPNNPWSAPAGPPVLVGAGDIARCYQPENPTAITPASLTAAEATASLLDRIPGTVIAVGDNAYELGSPSDYLLCYHPTWGRHKARTRPAAGNHEYLTPGAAGYFGYFFPDGSAPGGYYSYDLGGWHVIVLNSTPQWASCPPPKTSPADGRTCVGDVAQRLWLIADLQSHPARCTVAYFHHPRYSSGRHGSQFEMQQLWDILYAHGVDVVVSAHDHLYERFAPQDPEGNADNQRGIRQFTVGTGGAELYEFRTILPNSEARDNSTHGVLALALGDGRYGWSFFPTAGGTFRDYGTGTCH